MRLNHFIFRYGTCMLLLTCLCILVGCGNNVRVTGTVTYSDTGEPVRFGTVVFDGGDVVGRGTIRDGRFSVGRITDGDGIPPGTYIISANSQPVPAMAPAFRGDAPLEASEDRELYYTREPQTIEIRRSTTHDFQVERGVRGR